MRHRKAGGNTLSERRAGRDGAFGVNGMPLARRAANEVRIVSTQVSAQSSGIGRRTGYSGVGNRIAATLFGCGVLAATVMGWQERGERYLTPESGFGYVLGIIGGLMMVVMLFYSARKRYRFMRRWAPVRYWFRIHMVFGILGPALVLFHANFSLGAMNSNVALWSMLLVAASGIVGRFIYTRIHYGLYGARANLESLRTGAGETRNAVLAQFPFATALFEKMQSIEMEAAKPKGVVHGAFRALFLGFWTRRMRRILSRTAKSALKAEARQRGWSGRERRRALRALGRYIRDYMQTVRKVAGLEFFERLFALWHVVHIPFFIMMLLSSIVHVIAVHLY